MDLRIVALKNVYLWEVCVMVLGITVYGCGYIVGDISHRFKKEVFLKTLLIMLYVYEIELFRCTYGIWDYYGLPVTVVIGALIGQGLGFLYVIFFVHVKNDKHDDKYLPLLK